jgi:hypothetical protein
MTSRCWTCGRFVGACRECGARYCTRCQPMQHEHGWEPERGQKQVRRRSLSRLLGGRLRPLSPSSHKSAIRPGPRGSPGRSCAPADARSGGGYGLTGWPHRQPRAATAARCVVAHSMPLLVRQPPAILPLIGTCSRSSPDRPGVSGRPGEWRANIDDSSQPSNAARLSHIMSWPPRTFVIGLVCGSTSASSGVTLVAWPPSLRSRRERWRFPGASTHPRWTGTRWRIRRASCCLR